jgi:hypothetical protein
LLVFSFVWTALVVSLQEADMRKKSAEEARLAYDAASQVAVRC